MIDGYLHHIMVTRHLRAFVRRQFVRRTKTETSAVNVEHHWPAAAQARRPDVQLEHVFAHVAVVPILYERLFDRREIVEVLRAVGAIDESRALTFPCLGRLGRQPAIIAAGICAVGDALNVKTPPSTKPRTFPYCVFATA